MSAFWRTSSKRIFISFDYDNDRNYRYLLSALKDNPSSPIEFDDYTPGAINTDNVGRVKAELSRRIGQATHTLIIVGEFANDVHPDSKLIGDVNWQWWEVKKSIDLSNKLIGVKIKKENVAPGPLYSAGAEWALSYNVPAIVDAINRS